MVCLETTGRSLWSLHSFGSMTQTLTLPLGVPEYRQVSYLTNSVAPTITGQGKRSRIGDLPRDLLSRSMLVILERLQRRGRRILKLSQSE